MTTYTVQDWDGTTYSIDGPRGATKEQVVAAIRASLAEQEEERQRAPVEAERPARRAPVEDSTWYENLAAGMGAGAVGTFESAALGTAALLEEEEELAAREKIKGIASQFTPEFGDPDSFAYTAGTGIGSLAAFFSPLALPALVPAGGIASAVAGAGAVGATAALGIAGGAGEASERARAADATEDERNAATLLGAGVGLSEIAPWMKVLSRVPGVRNLLSKADIEKTNDLAKQPSGPLAKPVRIAGKLVRKAGAEGAQEVFAEVAQDAIEKYGYNPDHQFFDGAGLEELKKAAQAGGVAGAVAQAAIMAFGGKRRTTTPSAPDEAAPDAVTERTGTLPTRGELFGETVEDDIGSLVAAYDETTGPPEAIPEQRELNFGLDPEPVDRPEAPSRGPTPALDIVREPATEAGTAESQVAETSPRRVLSVAQEELRALEDIAAETDPEIRGAALDAKRISKEDPAALPERIAAVRSTIDEATRALPPEQTDLFSTQGELDLGPLETRELDDATIEELSAISDADLEGDRFLTEQAQPEQPRPTPEVVDAKFLDDLGIPKKGQAAKALRKNVEGKPLNVPEVRENLAQFANNRRVGAATRANIIRNIEGTPEGQTDLFMPPPPTPTAQRTVPTTPEVARGVTPTPEVAPAVAPTPEGTPSPTGRRRRNQGTQIRGFRPPAPAQDAKQPTKGVAKKKVAKKKVAEKKVAKKKVAKKKVAKKKVAEKPIKAEEKVTLNSFKELSEAIQKYAKRTFSTTFPSLGPERATAKDIAKVQAILEGPREGVEAQKLANSKDPKVIKALRSYFGKSPRLTDSLAMAIFDVVNKSSNYRRQGGSTDEEAAFFQGMGQTSGKRVLAWAEANLSPELNAWIRSNIEEQKTDAKRLASVNADTVKATDQSRNTAAAKLSSAIDKQLAKEAKTEAVEVVTGPDGDTRTSLDTVEGPSDADLLSSDLNNALELPNDALGALNISLHPAVMSPLSRGDLRTALLTLADMAPNTRVQNVARKLVKVVGTTKVEIVSNLKNTAGRRLAGVFDPTTNTIRLSKADGLNAHVLLHEMVHAATAATIANKKHLLTRKLQKLYDSVKNKLPDAYGMTGLEEFVAEALGNPSFQSDLALVYPDGSAVSALKRFFNTVGNYVRKLVGMRPKPVLNRSAMTEADRLIEGILYPAPESRFGAELAMDPRGVLDVITSGKVTPPKLPEKNRFDWLRRGAVGARDVARKLPAIGTFGLFSFHAIRDFAGKLSPKLGAKAEALEKLINAQRRKTELSDERVGKVAKHLAEWVKTATTEQYVALRDVIYSQNHGATIWQVDPTLTKSAAKNKYDAEKFAIWEAQRTDWERLGDDGRRTYKRMRNEYRRLYSDLIATINGRLDALKDGVDPKDKAARAERAKTIKQVKDRLNKALTASGGLDVYFPLLRSGEHIVTYELVPEAVVEGGDSFVIERFESAGDADAHGRALENDPRVRKVKVTTDEEYYGPAGHKKYSRDAPDGALVNDVLQLLDKGKVPSKVKDSVVQLFVDALPETALAKSLQKRKGTLGYVPDAIEAFDKKAFSLGRQIVRMQETAKLKALETEIRETAATISSSDWILSPTRVAEELIKRSEFARTGGKNKILDGIAKRANQVAFLITIGFNPSSALVNASQVPLVGLPMLGGKYGYAEATAAIANATRLVFTAQKGAPDALRRRLSIAHGVDAFYVKDDSGRLKLRTDLDLSPEQTRELREIQPLVQGALDQGMLTKSFLLDVLGLHEGQRPTRKKSTGGMLDKMVEMSAVAFNQVERFNRQTMLVASYSLAKKDIAAKDSRLSARKVSALAVEQAIKDTTEYNGGAFLETAPRISQEHLGRVAFMYKTYGLNMYYMMLKTAGAMFRGDPAAAKQMAGLFGTSAFFGGVVGMPLYGLVRSMADLLFFDDEEEDFDNFMARLLPDVVRTGPVNAALGVDVGSRTKLSDLVIAESRFVPRGESPDDAIERMWFETLGVAGSVTKRAARAAELFGEEGIASSRAWEQTLPTGVANLLKANRLTSEDGYRTRNRELIYETSLGENFAQSMGFSPTGYAETQRRTSLAAKIDGALTNEMNRLRKRYRIAVNMGDIETAREVWSDIQKWNREKATKDRKLLITRDSLRRSLDSARRLRKTMDGGYTYRFPRYIEQATN